MSKWIVTSNLSADKIYHQGREIKPTNTLSTIKPFPILTSSFKGQDALCDDDSRYDIFIDKLNNVDSNFLTLNEDNKKSFKFKKAGYYFIKAWTLESGNTDLQNRYVIGLTKKNNYDYMLFHIELNYHYPYLEYTSIPFYISDIDDEYQITYTANNTLNKDYRFKEEFQLFIFKYNH